MIKNIFSGEFEKGFVILFIAMNLFNFFNLIFHFAMGRMLGPEDYGTLVVLLSIIEIYGIPSDAISNIIVKYASKFNARKEEGKIKFMMKNYLKKGILISFLILAITIIIGYFFSVYLKINFLMILTINILIFSLFLNPLYKGVLQGRKKFFYLGTSFIIEGILKLGISILLVWIGFQVWGPIGGILIGTFCGILISIYFNKDISKYKETETDFSGLKIFTKNYMIISFIILILLNTDVILAKRFFSPLIAGQYAAISIIGKIIFLGTISISKVMFPFASESKEKNENSSGILKKSLTLASLVGIAIVFVLYLFPEEIINLLYGKDYISISGLLIYPAIGFIFLSLTNIILIYGVSTEKIRNTYYLFLFPLSQIVLLYILSEKIMNYVLGVMFFNMIIFLITILIFIKWKIKK